MSLSLPAPYSHERLPPGYLRLLRVKSSQTHFVDCEIQKFPLNEAPPFTALSYTWDNQPSYKPVLLNKRVLDVTPNAESFLRQVYMRCFVYGSLAPCWLWIDSICINQKDDKDKSEQVTQMGSIYIQAERIVIWLGEAKNETESLFGVMSSSDIEPRIHPCMIDLVSQPYWVRVWRVQQEASTPKPVGFKIIWRGNYGLDFSVFATAIANSSSLARNVPGRDAWILVQQPLLLLLKCLRARESDLLESRKSLALIDFLPNIQHLGAANPRDRIYALKEFCKDSDSLAFRPNYGLPVREVFINVAKQLFVQEKDLDLLAYGVLNRQDSIPSWVPDWGLTPLPSDFPKPKCKQGFDLNFSADAEMKLNYDLKDNNASLQLRGIIVGKVFLPSPGTKERRPTRTLCQSAMHGWSSEAAILFNVPSRDYTRAAISNDSSDDESDDAYSVAPDAAGNSKTWTPSTIRDRDLMRHRRAGFFRTPRYKDAVGFIGPADVKTGDIIFVAVGCQYPLALRSVADSGNVHYQIIGSVFSAGFMYGESFVVMWDKFSRRSLNTLADKIGRLLRGASSPENFSEEALKRFLAAEDHGPIYQKLLESLDVSKLAVERSSIIRKGIKGEQRRQHLRVFHDEFARVWEECFTSTKSLIINEVMRELDMTALLEEIEDFGSSEVPSASSIESLITSFVGDLFQMKE